MIFIIDLHYMGFYVHHLCIQYEKNVDTYIGYTNKKICVLEMFLICVFKNFDPLSLHVSNCIIVISFWFINYSHN
jgi:hypothetical protein